MGHIHLSDMVRGDSPEAVLQEVRVILAVIAPELDSAPVSAACRWIVRVFRGRDPAYEACNTDYHDLRHTTDTFLAMARLIHGAVIHGEPLTHREMVSGLISALFHDAGYIQKRGDREGTGAKFTMDHVERSARFLVRHGRDHGLSEKEVSEGRTMILCTNLSLDLSALSFPSPEVELLGKFLCAADLWAQMSDRAYLEKLLLLYHEFREGNMGDYQDEVDFLRKTPAFYTFIERRLAPIAEKIDRFMGAHFSARWGIEANLYAETIEGQRRYLNKILALPGPDPRRYLRRFSLLAHARAQRERTA